MKLSKQFMQTNIKQSYLYWQLISLNNLQQGTDGLSSGNSYKENSRSKSIRSTFFPNFVKITDLFLFISLIRLLFYVLMNPSLGFHGANPSEAHSPTACSLQKHCFMNWAICSSLIQHALKWWGRKQNNMQMLYKGLTNLKQTSEQFIVLFIPLPIPWPPI